SDRTVLLESGHPLAGEAAVAIAPFAQLSRTPEYIHTYTITPLGLWSDRASGHDAESVGDVLLEFAKFPLRHELIDDSVYVMDRFGEHTLIEHPLHALTLTPTEARLVDQLLDQAGLVGKCGKRIDAESVLVHPSERGELKHALLQLGHPVSDHAGYVHGEAHEIDLSD